jgi:Zn-finger nucleic acid-binding protein
MQIESLNCPNCGAGVMSDAVRCIFCHTRLKTMACPKCLGLMFQGSKHCPKCGEEAVAAQPIPDEKLGDCPRCKVRLSVLQIDRIMLRECERCEGLWSDAETFENICADRESHAAVMQWSKANPNEIAQNNKIQYVPCPDCKQLMNRNNFARSSGVIIDICKSHGVWFDAEELPRIIDFIHAGGLDRARKKEKMQLDEDKRELREAQYRLSQQQNSFPLDVTPWNRGSGLAVRDFVRLLFD